MSRPWSRAAPDPAGLAALCSELMRIRATPYVAMLRGPLLAGSTAQMSSVHPALRAASPVGALGTSASGAAPEPRSPRLWPSSRVEPCEPGPGTPAHERTRGTDTSIGDLVRRAQEGDSEAFGQLYDSYLEMVFRFVLYRVDSQALAEDIVSETFLRALRSIRTFNWQGRDIGAWFITIARNLIIDHNKSGRSRLEFPTDDILSAARAQVVSGPEESVLAIISKRTLTEAIRALSPDQQECVVLRFMEGLSVRETALAMGRNEGSVKALQHRAVRALARRIPQEAV